MTRFQLTIRYGNCESAVVNHHGWKGYGYGYGYGYGF
jgi:hypothetical protein